MPFDFFTNTSYNIVPEEQLRIITCQRYGEICEECTCDKCEGTGQIKTFNYEKPLPDIFVKQCSCEKIALSRHRLEQSGLGSTVKRYTLESYKADSAETEMIKAAATAYIEKGFNGKRSFFISGNPGSGKTHICVAIAQAIMMKGHSFFFFNWINDTGKLKRNATDAAAYDAVMKDAKDADLLYIDDFMKNDPNGPDKRLAMELIGTRYNSGKPFIISSERSISELKEIDAALAGRIVEMTGKFNLVSPRIDRRNPKKNIIKENHE